jgi:CheY-like chemotaxis protein
MTGELKSQGPAEGGSASARSPGVLIADGMALILTLLKVELESRGFAVWLAVDGDDVLDLYRKHRDGIGVVLLEVQMPGLDGPQTLEALRRLNPDVVACFMTGSGSTCAEEELLGRGAARVFRKPFRPADVADALQAVASVRDSTPLVCEWQPPSARATEPRALEGKGASSAP